jgi:predicted alpha/beta hydrolase
MIRRDYPIPVSAVTDSEARPPLAVRREELPLLATDAYPLWGRLFVPAGAVLGTVIVNGATAVPQSYYDAFASNLAARGMRVVTYDYRGIGRSRPGALRGFQATMSDWAERDARAVFAHVRERFLGPVALVGHSFGGQLLGLVDELGQANGMLLVGAQFGYYGHWPAFDRARYALLWRAAVPLLTAGFGYLPGRAGLGADLPAGVAREWARWCSHPDYLMGYNPAARERFARLRAPIAFYSFSDDDYAPAGAVQALLSVLPGASVQHQRISPRDLGVEAIGHFGFFRRRFEQSLWADAASFLTAVLEGRHPDSPPARRRPFDPWAVEREEIMADLEFGRA